jgi:hypothetical protein
VRGKYLGDTYDLVKRVWAESLRSIGPLYAYPKFIPPGIRDRFAAVTLIPILDTTAPPKGHYGIFLDPHTGIPLPEPAAGPTAKHSPLQFIAQVNESLRPAYMICFDQSYHRKHKLTVGQQRERKRAFLQEQGIGSFYYVSHVPFLFMAQKPGILHELRQRLLELGIPPDRLEPADVSPDTPNQERTKGYGMQKNVQYVTDAEGHKTAVILPIEEYEDLMHDLAMGPATRGSKAEPRRPLEDVVKELRRPGEIED